jgi:REP element-mobilizing transposase RayT
MAYPPREQIAGATYHVATRATGPSELFRDRHDRRRFMRILPHVVRKYRWRLHAYCLMGTHYHLVFTTPQPTLARGMQLLNSLYARTFNERHRRLGHLVAARYASAVVESEAHALELCRYLPLNPVRAGLCRRPEQWPWSSYAATIGRSPEPPFLEHSWILGWFGDDVVDARESFREDVEAASDAAVREAGAVGREPARGYAAVLAA